MLSGLFALLFVASALGLWRVGSRSRKAQGYLAAEGGSSGQLSQGQMSPEQWEVVAPLRTIQRVVHGELGALESGASSPVTASLAVNAELQHWFDRDTSRGGSPRQVQMLHVLSLQIDAIWERGEWGTKHTFDPELFVRRLQSLEDVLRSAEVQLIEDRAPYRR